MKCKKIFATLMALMLMMTSMSILSFADGELGEFPATFQYADGSWVWNAWQDATTASATVTGAGTYEVVLDGAAQQAATGVESGAGAMVFCVDMLGMVSAATEVGKEVVLTDVKLFADGTEVAIDASKVVYGDIEEKGNFRIELYNEYGSTKADPCYDFTTFSWSTELKVQFTLDVVEKVAEYPIAIQFASAEWASQVWQNAETATAMTNGAGTYKVALTTADFVTTDENGETTAAPESVTGTLVFCVDLLGMQAGLDEMGKTVSLTDIKVTADGTEVAVDASKVACADIEDNGNTRIEIYNEYGVTKEDPAIDAAALTWTDTLEIEFTIDIVDKTYEYPMGLQYSNTDWSFGIWQDETTACGTFTGNGTYSVTISSEGMEAENAGGVLVFCLDILGLAYDVADFDAVQISDVKVLADGVDVGFDGSKIKYGWLESNTANYRIEFYNDFGATKENPGLTATDFGWNDTLELQFTVSGLKITEGINGEQEVTFEPIHEFDPAGSYNAYFGVQTDDYTFRNAWNEENYGAHTEYFNQLTGWDADNNAVVWDGTFADATVAGNGTYRVGVSGANWDDAASLNMLFVSTNIPYGYEEIVISDVKVLFGGNEIYTFEQAFLDEESGMSDGYIKIMAVNTYNADLKDLFGYTLNESIELEFTISGFSYDKAPDVEQPTEEPTEEPTEAPTPAPTEAPTQAPTEAPTEPASDDDGVNGGVIAGIVVAVVAVAGGAAAVVLKKKKK